MRSRLSSPEPGRAPAAPTALRRLLVVAVMGLALALTGALAAPASALPGGKPCKGATCTVTGDPEGAAYVGDGGLLLPASSFSGDEADRHAAAECQECRWALVPLCKRSGVGSGSCGAAAHACPAGQARWEVLLRRPGQTTFASVGLVCLSPGGPVTVSDVADRLHDVVVEQVPGLRPAFQPAGLALVGLPTLFSSGQPAVLDTRQFTLVGFDVVLDARATWEWSFGDGASLVTDEPGGGYPVTSVSHDYPRPGDFVVTVTTRWEGWFTVDGLGPFPTGGPAVSQTTQLAVPVVEARAVLVAG